jgi:hypothetical protein
MADPQPASPTEALFRQAIETNNAIHAQALADLQRRSDEAYGQLKQLTSMHMFTQSYRAGVNAVMYAMSVDPEFAKHVAGEAQKILQDKGILPATPDTPEPVPAPTPAPEPVPTPEPIPTPTPGGDAGTTPGEPFPAKLPLLRVRHGGPGRR